MRIVFLGFNHRKKDPRLYYREMRVLQSNIEGIQIFFAKEGRIFSFDELELDDDSGASWVAQSTFSKIATRSGAVFRSGKNQLLLAAKLRKLRPSCVQASDAKEIPFALCCKFLLGASIVYDSHEDYVRQALDYDSHWLIKYPRAIRAWLFEAVGVRLFDAVFCTDDFLVAKYRKSFYGAKSVSILRNFPPRAHLDGMKRSPVNRSGLNLVYIGGVNRARGVLEVAKYVRKINRENPELGGVSFHLYAPRNALVDEIGQICGVDYYGWIDFEKLRSKLREYDVGVCLWKRVPKLERNLPLKNFDYMAAGLPVLTSDFGNLQKYAVNSGAALCIDPDSFEEFREAVIKLSNENFRRALGDAGVKYIDTQASFENEARDYVSFVKSL